MSKINQCWNEIFADFDILKKINDNGFYIIKSDKINTYYQSRLAAYIDTSSKMPDIFIDNRICILPISRGEYILCRSNMFHNFEQDHPFIMHKIYRKLDFLNFFNKKGLFSENIAIHYAFYTGIINDLIKEGPVYFVMSGRMSTGFFDFDIYDELTKTNSTISVRNSQCEIDAGFESKNNFLIIEAKNRIDVSDFLIRQLSISSYK